VTVRSEPVDVEAISAADFFGQDSPGADGVEVRKVDDAFEAAEEWRYKPFRGAVALVIPHQRSPASGD
jgi:hypothetical protein